MNLNKCNSIDELKQEILKILYEVHLKTYLNKNTENL